MQLGKLFEGMLARKVRTAAPAEFLLDSAELYNAPYAAYRRMRRAGPILPCRPAGFALTRHADIKLALSHPDLGNAPSRFSTLHSRNAEKYVAANLASNIPPFLDKPEHVVVRRAITSAFFACFRDFTTQLEALARTQAQDFASVGGGDLVETFAKPFTIQVMCHFLGLPTATGAEPAKICRKLFPAIRPDCRSHRLQSGEPGSGSLQSDCLRTPTQCR
ncbi:hypothetical protein PSQ19_13670 [Devosia algicola]|uniref:Cytochrome P450 n=1 Tax=Devosia algicola TaxID=3026418 RepID=A0ABY7YKE8_9HYPH|nr:hypothetical protein [Devosia algicola]WDR01775.1 hypothetical protein PSQ19_13670 [Devosia algicola]